MTTINLDSWTEGGHTRRWSRKGLRSLLNIRSRDTLIKSLTCLGLNDKRVFTAVDAAEVLAMHLFLRAGNGDNRCSRDRYRRLKRVNMLPFEFKRLGINLEEEIRRVLCER